MYEPLITLYTPTYRRPKLLERNITAVREMYGVRVVEHVVIPDAIGIGIGGVFREIKHNLDKINGMYVYVYQDDDVLFRDDAIDEFATVVRENHYPPVVICKNIKDGRILPDRWGQKPELGYIDLGSYIVRRDVFCQYADKFGARYEGDYDFIRALWDAGIPFFWWDFIFCKATQVGKGMPE